MKSGVFWVVEDKLLDFPFGTVDTQDGIAKSGTTYNHKRLWKAIKPERCNKSYNYYPRGRVEITNKGRAIVYMNPNISEQLIPEIIKAFELVEHPEIRLDCSRHYRCYLDEGLNQTIKTEVTTMDMGYKNDEIFLLSIEEYGHYKKRIPHENCWWWLRSPGHHQLLAAGVNGVGSVSCGGDNVHVNLYAVRPALKYSNIESKIFKSTIHQNRFLFNEFPFRIIDEENKIAIAEVPITFDRFDATSNDYETSYIRRKLLSWFETGVWDHE